MIMPHSFILEILILGLTPIGASRSQVLKVEYKKDWETIVDKESEKFMPKQSGDYGMATQSGEVIL